MKNNRQEKILAIIEAEPIETQEQLLAKLQEQGIESTQATISRDIKQLHLIKEPVGLATITPSPVTSSSRPCSVRMWSRITRDTAPRVTTASLSARLE